MNTSLEEDNRKPVFEFTGGEDFRFKTWKNSASEFFAVDSKKDVIVVSPVLVEPEGWVRNQRSALSELAVVRIRKTRLIFPPCRACKEDNPFTWLEEMIGQVPDEWELSYGFFTYPEADDHEELQTRLDKWKEQRLTEKEQRERAAESIDMNCALDRIYGKSRKRLPSLKKGEKSPWPRSPDAFSANHLKRFKDQERQAVEGHFRRAHGRTDFDATLDDVLKNNIGDIRNAYLIEEWAKVNGIDLSRMKREERAFWRWFDRCYKPIPRKGHGVPDEMNWDKRQALLASVRFEIEFANGERAWLTDVKIRPREEMRAEEQRELNAVKEATEVESEQRVVSKIDDAVAKLDNASERLQRNANAVKEATEIGDLYASPSMASAKDESIKKGVPKEFVAYCHTQMHAEKFPSIDQAHKATRTSTIFKGLRSQSKGGDGPSRATVARLLATVREELERRGLLQPKRRSGA